MTLTRPDAIDDILSPLSETPFQAYLSEALQVSDILDWCLQQTGPADVRQTTFSISEEHLRRIYRSRQSGLIRSFELVLDHKATNKTVSLWQFISQVVDRAFLADNHSKVILIKSDSLKVSVVTSQNLTRGNRFEAAAISADPAVFDRLSLDLDYIVNSHSLPLDDILRSADPDD